jgi:hypothetical protein
MFSFALRDGPHKETGFVQVISVLNLIFTFFLMVALIFTGIGKTP